MILICLELLCAELSSIIVCALIQILLRLFTISPGLQSGVSDYCKFGTVNRLAGFLYGPEGVWFDDENGSSGPVDSVDQLGTAFVSLKPKIATDCAAVGRKYRQFGSRRRRLVFTGTDGTHFGAHPASKIQAFLRAAVKHEACGGSKSLNWESEAYGNADRVKGGLIMPGENTSGNGTELADFLR